MPHVDDHATLLRRSGRRKELAVLHRVVPCPAIGVGEDIARAQEIEEVREIARRRADMAHDARPLPRHLGGAEGAAQGLEPVLADHGVGDADLDAEHQVGVLRHRLGGALHVGVVDIQHLAGGKPTRQADARNVDEAEEAGARLGHREVLERAEGVPAAIAGGYRGGGGGDGHQLVGGQPQAQVRHEMGMQIHQAGCHELPRRIDPLHAPGGGNAGREPGDLAEPDADVQAAAEALAGVQHLAPRDDEVVLERGICGIEAGGRGGHGLGELHRAFSLGGLGGGAGKRSPGGGARSGRSGTDEVAAGKIHGDHLVGEGSSVRGSSVAGLAGEEPRR